MRWFVTHLLVLCTTWVLALTPIAQSAGLGSLLGFNPEHRFTSEEYQQIRQVALNLLDACPPPDCGIVALGRSPTAIAAFLDLYAPGSVSFLPLSSFKHLPHKHNGRLYYESLPEELKSKYPMLRSDYISQLRPLSLLEEDRLFMHFHKFLPAGKRKLLFFDIGLHGFSVISAIKYAEKFYATQGGGPVLQPAVVMGSATPEAETMAFLEQRT